MDTSLITIVKQRNILGKSTQQAYLIHRKCRTRIRHHILQSTLVHGNHISITFHHIDSLFFYNCLFCLIDTIEFTLLVVDF